MDELRIAVVGVGRMGLTHAENLAHRVRGSRLIAVTTSNAERAAEARRRCGAVSVYGDLDQLLAAEDLDAIIISSSTSAHVDNVLSCAAAGLHIMCEKPMTFNLDEAKELRQLVHESGIVFGLLHNYTGYPMVKLARDMVRNGDLGQIRKIVVQYPQGWLSRPMMRGSTRTM